MNNSNWQEEFDKKFCGVVGHETIKTFLNPRDTAIKAFISSLLEEERQGLVKEVEKLMPDVGIIAASSMSSEANYYMEGYYKAQKDCLSLLTKKE